MSNQEGLPLFCFFPGKSPVTQSSRDGLTGLLQEKTGVTGAATLGVGVGAYLISKELYVVNSEVNLLGKGV